MSSPTDTCPELETLFTGVADGDQAISEHAFSCPACSLILEDHRQLEKDLFRIQDPLPPMDFTAQVMAKVATAPVPVATELRAGLGILIASVSMFVLFLLSGGNSAADAGASLARGLIHLRTLLVALGTGLEALWGTAAVPFVVASLLILITSFLGLRRLSAAPQSA